MDNVNHPAHYNMPGRKECIEEMLDKFGSEKVQNFCELNAYKYQYRHEMKNGEEDLQKASWYLQKKKELETEDPRHLIANQSGLSNQMQLLIEEMAELTQAICKMKRLYNRTELPKKIIIATWDNLVEEMADVQVMLDQFTISNPIWDRKIEQIKLQKAKRQLERIKNGK